MCATSPEAQEQAIANAQAAQRNTEIEKMLKAEKLNQREETKILLLGTGDAGKTTILKQMRLLYGVPFTAEEVVNFRSAVFINLIGCAKSLVVAMAALKIPYGFDPGSVPPLEGVGDEVPRSQSQSVSVSAATDVVENSSVKSGKVAAPIRPIPPLPDCTADGNDSSRTDTNTTRTEKESLPEEPKLKPIALKAIKSPKDLHIESMAERQFETSPNIQPYVGIIKNFVIPNYGFLPTDRIPADVVDAISQIWADAGVQYCYSRSNEFQLMESCNYMMTNLTRITELDYTPTELDIINARIMTTAVSKTTILFDEKKYLIFDVGGQRSQRKKWAPYFDDVQAIIFVIALSAYDQNCFEDSSMNRMMEALVTFQQIIRLPLFKKNDFIIFMNKIDIFREKLRRSVISHYFPDYKGPNSFEKGAEFFIEKFTALNNIPTRGMYFHLTSATDANQIKGVLNAVWNSVVNSLMEATGFI